MLANSENPDQTPRCAASDLGLPCLPMSQKWDSMLKWVNTSLKHPEAMKVSKIDAIHSKGIVRLL